MATEDAAVAPTPEPAPVEAPKKKRGPKPRAEIEAEIRAELEAKIRSEFEEAEKAKTTALDAAPINADDVAADPTAEGAVTIHFVTDGFTVLGKVWYYGENLTIVPGTPNWEEAHKILTLDEYEQEAKWGKRIYRSGPWRGARLDEIDTTDMTATEIAQLQKAQQEHDRKYGPVLTQ